MNTHNPLAELIRRATEYNAKVERKEIAPDTSYGGLLDMILEYADQAAPQQPEPQPDYEGQTVYECPECDWTGTMDTINGLHHVHHIQERIEAGELVPAGCCPDCGALISVADRDIPHYVLYDIAQVMQARGWTVAAPAGCPPVRIPTKGE